MNCDLKAGRELDALVAEKVMGIKLCRCYGQKPNEHNSSARCFDCKCINSSMAYSTDIAAAWEVVEKLAAYNPSKFLIEKCGAWLVRFDDGTFTPGETAPHAICLAALKAVNK